jgi:DNA/RNA-binding domain of Phe-tRNA-synthetase-like protein
VIQVEPHPLLALGAFRAVFPKPLVEMPPPPSLRARLAPGASGGQSSSDELRAAVRDLLRHGGYKPTGRGKPSSEYLLRAVGEGALESINLAVDACNAASFSGGLPISVVDWDLVREPLRVGIAEAGASYVFNRSGQEIRLDGLLCLFDAVGPCANAVKDSERTKTHGGTRAILALVWGTRAFPERTDEVVALYRELLEESEVATERVAVE